MAVVDIRRRTGYLFLAVIVAQILLISAQVNSKSGVPILESVTFGLFAELERGTASLTGSVRRTWAGYVDLRQVRAENETLKRQLADAQIQVQEQRALTVARDDPRRAGKVTGSACAFAAIDVFPGKFREQLPGLRIRGLGTAGDQQVQGQPPRIDHGCLHGLPCRLGVRRVWYPGA